MGRRGGLKTKGLDERENYTLISIDNVDNGDSTDLLASSLQKQIKKLAKISLECCIYKVPPAIRVLNEMVYTPQVVSIGPFHHNKKELQGMKEHKLRYMKVFLSRTTTSLKDFIKATRGFEERAMNCYAEKIDLSVDEFVRILIIDSLFILEAMTGKEISGPHQASFYLPKQVFHFLTDLILLENQIPFFVLNDLYELAFPEYPQMKFLEYSINYLSDVFLISESLISNESNFLKKMKDYLDLGLKIKHFVDLVRIIHLPSLLRKQPVDEVKLISIPNAVQLQEARIQLKSDESDCLLDIKYTKGVLKIPLSVVQEYSEIVLTNILVLENCHYLHDSYIRDYVFFMQMLVDTAEDAKVLIEKKIIKDWTGESSTVASLFNKVGNNILIYDTNYYFFDTSKNLNKYSKALHHVDD